MALAKMLQACTEKSEFPTEVLSGAAHELQQCMAPLLVLNGDEIVEVSLLRLIEGECRTSPMPEEATLLGDIKPDITHDIKCKIESPRVSEQLQICEPLLQPFSHPILLNQVPSLLRRKGSPRKGQLEQMQSVSLSGSGLENYRLPKWWREFWSLLQCPCYSAIQKLAHQQATAFWIPTTQLEKGGWVDCPTLSGSVGVEEIPSPKDFQGSHNYQDVRREERVILAMALQNCAV